MKKVILGMVIGIVITLIGGFIVVQATGSITANQILYNNSNTSTTNVKTALDELVNVASGINTKTLVFTTSPVNMKTYTDKWAQLTTADFIVGSKSANISIQGEISPPNGNFWQLLENSTINCTISYNASTGELTFERGGKMILSSSNNQWSGVFMDNTFAVYLGTVGGK